jgi:hypothetical protein
VTRSITTWTRLEPRSTAPVPGPQVGLEARVYDAAWLLGRQWQLGELTGEDAASPATVRVRLASSRLTRYRPGRGPGDGALLGPDALLEPIVEAEAAAPDDARSSAEAGAHFLSLLAAAGLQQLRGAFVESYQLPAPAGRDDPLPRLLRRRSIDGAALRDNVRAAATAAGRPVALPDRPAVPSALEARLLDVLGAWLAWYPAALAGPSWIAERMEYRFAVAGPSPTGDGEVVLEAREYEGGRLDWPDLRVAEGATLGAAGDAAPSRALHAAIPTPVAYPGMPASRWWEFEDARVWFGGIETEAGDLARMLLVEFATVYGNDWFVVPLELPVGALAELEALVVVDTFGQATLVRSTELARAGSGETPWRMFRPSGAPPALLVVPPVVAHGLEGPMVEEVVLLRDETANMAWAVERRVTGPAGNVVDRYERWRERLASSPTPVESELMSYRLATAVPDHWIPLVPRSVGLRSIRLERGSVMAPDGTTFPPQGRLLEPDRPLALFEEEVPRSGLAVTRAWQLARAPDGATFAWIGRRKRPGRGEGSSGLAFDQLSRPQT